MARWCDLAAGLVLLAIVALSRAQESDESDFPCYSLSRDNYTCDACIQYHPTCAWCRADDFSHNHPRCDTEQRLKQHGCADRNIEFPKSMLKIVKDEALRDAVGSRDAIMLQPQHIKINLRPHDKETFTVRYRQAKDYPVDLYYLMDLSHSMADDKENLANLGGQIAGRMRNITKNFRLGFGSFVDKALIPFVDPRPEKRDFPCENVPSCSPPYGFRHEMTLSEDAERFKSKVENSRISGNLDAPEGGFDAIMQSLACTNDIGWRQKSRKMIVFSTDAGFHYAGDGRLAGVVVPNDGQCHMEQTSTGLEYAMSSEQDYPSIAQLHQKVRETQANLIFAVTVDQVPLYRRLSTSLPDIAASVGELAGDSSNVVELIETAYRNIAQKIIMVDNVNASQGLRMSYRTKCKDKNGILELTNTCDDVHINETIEFEVTIEHLHCVQDEYKIQLGPSGLSDHLILDVTVDCKCDCAKTAVKEKSRECSNHGHKVCGVCACEPGWIGNQCECNLAEISATSTAELDRACRRFNESEICEGRGTCVCGQCQCFDRPNIAEKITGQFCECDNFACPRDADGRICSGHGTCTCGACKCQAGWEDMRCGCPVDTATCINPENGKLCSGHGRCDCGRCKCDERYVGPYCESCKTCPTKCVEYRPCVLCQTWHKGPYNETMCQITRENGDCPFDVIIVQELPEHNNTRTDCQFVDERDCTYYFQYEYNEEYDNVTVWVREEMDCPPPVPIIAIILGLIAGIVLIGLILLLVWKLLTMLHDRREFALFEQERLMAKWDTGENPIFTPATSTFKNPAYAGRQ